MDVSVDLTRVVLETDRLTLRGWREDDLGDFYAYASVEGVGEMAGWPHHTSVDVSRGILESFIREKNVFALVYKENGRVIGSLGLHESWANRVKGFESLRLKEIGYVLSRDYWGKGLMPEAVGEVIRWAFTELSLDALTVGHFTENAQSRLIEKCGFSYVTDGEYEAKLLNKVFAGRKYILMRES